MGGAKAKQKPKKKPNFYRAWRQGIFPYPRRAAVPAVFAAQARKWTGKGWVVVAEGGNGREKVTVLEKGVKLTSRHEDILLAAVSSGTKDFIEEDGLRYVYYKTSLYKICKELGLEPTKGNRDWVAQMLEDLKTTTVWLKKGEGKSEEGIKFNIIEYYHYTTTEDGNREYHIRLHSTFARLVENGYIRIAWKERKQLQSPLAKALYRYVSSMRKGILEEGVIIPAKKVFNEIGYSPPQGTKKVKGREYTCIRWNKVKEEWKQACEELERVGIIISFSFSGKKADWGVVSFRLAPSPLPLRRTEDKKSSPSFLYSLRKNTGTVKRQKIRGDRTVKGQK